MQVVAAVIAGAQASRTSSNANRGIQFAVSAQQARSCPLELGAARLRRQVPRCFCSVPQFLFILVFAVTVYFREELWSISRGEQALGGRRLRRWRRSASFAWAGPADQASQATGDECRQNSGARDAATQLRLCSAGTLRPRPPPSQTRVLTHPCLPRRPSRAADVSKHPIMGYVEQLQISHYLGSKWLFGSGKDMTAEQLEVAQEITGQAGSNPAAPTASAGSGNSTAATTTTTAAASAPSGTTQQQQQPAAGATQAAAAAQPGGAAAAEPAKAAQAAASGGGGAGSAPAGAAAGAATRRSWARRLLTVHRSKCDSSNAKMLMRRLLVLAQRRVRG